MGAALDVLERASVSTIHALCAQILQERPLECGVLPGFKMADEAQADALFMDTWEEWLGERLSGGDDVLLDALEQGIPLEGDGWGERTSLRGLARKLIDQRDLEPLAAENAFDLEAAERELLQQAARGAQLAAQVREGDVLAARLVKLAEFAQALRFRSGSEKLAHLLRLEAIPVNFGFKPHWPSPETLAEGRAIAAWTKDVRPRWTAARGADLHGRLVRALSGVVRIYERKKAERGVLDFLDLLVKARNALRDHAGVRAWFQARFRYLVIDEFQDTDPLQVELARLIAGDRPGALVVVGDAKQSIYRFRRAEVRLFRELVREAEAASSGAVVHLTQNFRSRPAILGFVNRVFAGADSGLRRVGPARVRGDRAAAGARRGAGRRGAALRGGPERLRPGPARRRGGRPRRVPARNREGWRDGARPGRRPPCGRAARETCWCSRGGSRGCRRSRTTSRRPGCASR